MLHTFCAVAVQDDSDKSADRYLQMELQAEPARLVSGLCPQA